LVIVLVPTVMVLRSWVNSDSSGTVTVGKPAGAAASSEAQPVDISNQWFSASLPAGFTIKSQQTTPQTLASEYSVDSLTSGTEVELAISYGVMTGGLENVSGYQLRATQTNNYAPYTMPGAPAGSVAFRDLHDPYSSAAIVLFWPHNGSCVTVALTGGLGSSLNQLDTVFQQLLASWSWK
jgi:hypothetical protein